MSSSYVDDNFYKDIRQVDNQQTRDKPNTSPNNQESNSCVGTISSCAGDGDRNISNRSQQTNNFAANKDVHHVKETYNNNLVTMSPGSRHSQAIVEDDVQNHASNRKLPNNQSEFMIYRLLERANLLCYFETFVQLGGDDVQQLCDADDEEFLEIMDFVGMTKKPLHVRRLQKTLLEWKKSPDIFNKTTGSSTNMSLCHIDPTEQSALKALSDSRSSTTLSMDDRLYIPDRALASELNSTESKQGNDNNKNLPSVDMTSLPSPHDDSGVAKEDFYVPRSESMSLASTSNDKYSPNNMMTSRASTSNTSSSRSSLGIRNMSRQQSDSIEGQCYKKICNQSSSNPVDNKSKSIDHLHQKSVAEILRGQNDMISYKHSIGRINMQLSDNIVKQSTLHYKLSNNSTNQVTCLAHLQTSPSINDNAHDLTQQKLLLFPSSQYKDSVIALERRRHHNMAANALEYQRHQINYVTNGLNHVADNLKRSDSMIGTPIVAINSPNADINRAITSCQTVLIDKNAAENYEWHIIPTSTQMALPIVEPLNVTTKRIAFDFQQCPTNLVKNHQQQSDSTVATNTEHKICDTGRNEKGSKSASISVSTSPQNCFEFPQQERKSGKLGASKNHKKDMVSKSLLKSCEVSTVCKELCPSNTYANVRTKATASSDDESIVQVDVDDSDLITMSKGLPNLVLRWRKNGRRKTRQEQQHAFRRPG